MLGCGAAHSTASSSERGNQGIPLGQGGGVQGAPSLAAVTQGLGSPVTHGGRTVSLFAYVWVF